MIKLEIMEQKKLKYGASLKYLSNFWRTLEMCLINYEINLIWTCSANCVTVSTDVANQGVTFIAVVTLSNYQLLFYIVKGLRKLSQQLYLGDVEQASAIKLK